MFFLGLVVGAGAVLAGTIWLVGGLNEFRAMLLAKFVKP